MKKATLLHYGFSIIAFLLLSLTGVVHDAKNNSPLEGATVSLKSTKANTITKADGSFSISAPAGKAVLSISFVGYQQQSITVGVNETNVSVALSEASTSQLNDVIVIGYGTQKKKDLTGSVSSIKVTS
jgi:TonB-dependent starch-binding outer membrane protein SusC